ncbi:MAG TPA: hypothetical protein VNC22_18015 [Sporichthya sp.]|jgi:hypothetical protein|nr:hypothetical protein [Sporichthya sp.]
MTTLALSLSHLAGRLAKVDPRETLRNDPVAWAYAMREAVSVAGAVSIASHLDPRAEAEALGADHGSSASTAALVELLDGSPVLASLAPTSQFVRYVETVVAACQGRLTVLATVTAPATVCAALGVPADDGELDLVGDLIGDALAQLCTAYLDAGAAGIVLCDHPEGIALVPDQDLRRSWRKPIERVLKFRESRFVAVDLEEHAMSALWSLDQGPFADAIATLASSGQDLVVADVPGGVDPGRLREAVLACP